MAEPFDLTVLQEGAVAAHEIFAAYLDAGFTRIEALELVTRILLAGLPSQTKESDE